MSGVQAYRPFAVLVAFTLVLSRVSAVYDTTHNATLPSNSTAHYNPAKYSLPLPVNSTLEVAEGLASNATTHHNRTINSTMPMADQFDLQQSAKYILPVPNNTTSVTEGAKVESAATNTSVVASPTSASAQIESVPGFVRTQGQNFVVNGKAAYFAGTNAW